MGEAAFWGAIAASSLLIGALLGLGRRWPDSLLGFVLAFGSGALISAISFDLARSGFLIGGGRAVAIGLGAGALTFFTLDRVVSMRFGRSARGRAETAGAGPSLALGALLDGIPEQFVLGTGLATGGTIGIGLLVAIFVSNLPEAIGSASEMRAAGASRGPLIVLWAALTIVCTVSTVVGYEIAQGASTTITAAADGFAAGTLLVMLVDAMIPEALHKAGRVAGVVATVGFAVAAYLAEIS